METAGTIRSALRNSLMRGLRTDVYSHGKTFFPDVFISYDDSVSTADVDE